MQVQHGENRIEITDQDNDVTTSVAGANGFETVYDLSPDTNVYYKLLRGDHPQLGSEGNLRIRMNLPQESGTGTEIGDNARVRLVAQGPLQDDEGEDVLGEVFRYRRFTNAEQFDEDDVVRLNLGEDAKITEAAHLKLQVDNSSNSTNVDLAEGTDGFVSIELYRGVKR